jgi:hypothetical protein
MQNKSVFHFLARIFGLSALSFALFFSAAAQSKEEEEGNQVTLQSVTEALLVNGQPAMRIQFRNNRNAEVKLVKRDGEDALVFDVLKIVLSTGKLYVTKTKLTYIPADDPDKYVKIERSKIKKIEFKDHWRMNGSLSNVNVIYEGDEKSFSLAFPIKGDKQILLAANKLLLRAINDFDGAIVEFNQLTASVRPPSDEDEEAAEEETAGDVNDRYDRFKDISLVSTSKMLVHGSKRSIRTYAEYGFPGKTQKKPENISLYFYASAAKPLFHEDDLELNFLVDNKRLPIGKIKLADEEKTKTTTKQTLVVSLPYETFEQIAKAKKVEFQIGTLEYKLTDLHLDTFKKLLAYQIQE